MFAIILLAGIVLELTAFAGLFNNFFVFFALLLFFLPLFFILQKFFKYLPKIYEDRKSYFLLCFLLVVLLSHFVQVLVPETGFDAVWYHLPVAKEIATQEKIVYLPEFYQSLNPLFADLFFIASYKLWGDVGTKVIAYVFMIYLLYSVYLLVKSKLNLFWSLLLVLVVSVFQVVTWQASSFYIDIAKAFFEILALHYLVNQKNIYFSALLLGASIASKVFSVLLLPVFLFIIIYDFYKMQKTKKILSTVFIFTFLSFLLALPFYFFSFYHTGSFVPSVGIHLDKLGQIGGTGSQIEYVFYKFITLPFSLLQIMSLRDYVSPLVVLALFFAIKKVYQNFDYFSLFAINSWLVFWFVPPLSTRYALSGFIVLVAIAIMEISKLNNSQKKYFSYLIICSVFIFFLPRIYVNYRSLNYLLSNQTTKEYLMQFYDGNIDDKLSKWYELNKKIRL